MDKEVLIQYCEMKQEIKDIRRRIRALDRFLENPPVVTDSVTGSRRDLTIGQIKITGIPDPEYRRKERLRTRYRKLLEEKEAQLLDLTCQAEAYIESIPKAEMRIMFRLYYLDGLTWKQVANRMNSMFPKRGTAYSEDNCWRRNKRFFEKI